MDAEFFGRLFKQIYWRLRFLAKTELDLYITS